MISHRGRLSTIPGVDESVPYVKRRPSGRGVAARKGEMQADGLFALLSNLTATDEKRHCHCTTHEEPCSCFISGEDGNDIIVLRAEYHRVSGTCVFSDVVADFIYFGCGLHVLHHHPSRPISEVLLQRWTLYERSLEEVVRAYRSNGRLRSSYLGEAFMTTHPILLEKLEDPMLGDILQYVRRDAHALAACYKQVDELKHSLEGLELEVPAEDLCTRGYFADECVVDLNKRGKAVMDRLGVPVVPAYEINLGQAWATRKRDGRHYPALVPQELSHFLGIIATALKEETLARRT